MVNEMGNTLTCLQSGGNWNNTSNAGVWNVNLNNNRFVGYRTWQSKRFIRKHSLYKFFKMAKKNKVESMVSIAGHAKETYSLKHMMRRLRREQPETLNLLPNYCRLAAIH